MWDLSLDKERGRIEADLDIDSDRSGQRWKITMKHNGKTIYSGTRTTDADGEVGWTATGPTARARTGSASPPLPQGARSARAA